MAHRAGAATGGVFISYRRGDSAYPAAWLYRRLSERLGESVVFKDLDSIRPGDNFVETLDAALTRSRVLLAIIGPDWLSAPDDVGGRRIDDPDDFVRLEIETGLRRGIRVIPLLVGGATMPRPQELPTGLSQLSLRQALELTSHHFEADAEQLVDVIEDTLRPAPSTGSRVATTPESVTGTTTSPADVPIGVATTSDQETRPGPPAPGGDVPPAKSAPRRWLSRRLRVRWWSTMQPRQVRVRTLLAVALGTTAAIVAVAWQAVDTLGSDLQGRPRRRQ